ncbi:uncharacterized protein LOC110412418 [Herrania umbratica]|uniref:Uncharacterized protein LOC110412418 n=1 Tax=Herrania umbratica TaxID=108875 RepID=A0A6J0ZVB3_9ROSI|nr:uncharacterized protein LOC110412418 [Herrania umbratica]
MAQTKEERSNICQLAHRQRTMGGIPRPFNTSITPTYPIFGYPPFPMVPAQIPGFASQHGERMHGHMIAQNRSHPFQHSYPQSAISANNMRNRWNNERVAQVPTTAAAFSVFNPFGF